MLEVGSVSLSVLGVSFIHMGQLGGTLGSTPPWDPCSPGILHARDEAPCGIAAGTEGRILENTLWGESFQTRPGVQAACWGGKLPWAIKGG